MFKHIAILVLAVAKSFLANAKKEMKNKKWHATMCIANRVFGGLGKFHLSSNYQQYRHDEY